MLKALARRRSRIAFWRQSLLPLLLMMGLAKGAAATEQLPAVLTPYWSEKLSYDDNIFRLPDGTPSPNGSRSDLIRTDIVGIALDKSYAQQRLRFDTALLHQHYARHDALDFNAVNSTLTWDWTLTPSLRGVLLADRKQTPSNFADYRIFSTRNLRTNNTRLASLDYTVMGGWHLLASAARISSVSDDHTVATEDEFTATQRQFGLQYVFPSASFLQLSTRQTNGDYPNAGAPTPGLLNAPFHESAQELLGVWKATAKTTLSGRLTGVSRHHDDLPQRNFSGTTGRLDLNWDVTEKTAVNAGIGREFSTWQTDYSNYIASDIIYLAPVWQISTKTALTFRIDSARRRYLGEPFGPPPDQRHDRLQNAQLTFDWRLTQDTNVGASLQHSRRNSNYPGLDFTANTAVVNFMLRF